MSGLRRSVLLAGLVTVAVLVTALPAAADDLDDYLREAEQAEYAGRRIVVTMWDGESRAEVFEVVHAGDTMIVNGGESVVGYGKLAGAPGGGGVVIPEWSASALSDRYTMDPPQSVRRLGRDAVRVLVREGDAKRATIVFDSETSAPLATEVFGGDGELFRYTTMLEFDPNPIVGGTSADSGDYEVMLSGEVSELPETAAGYQRADVYAGPNDSVHAFYTDGLFYFSIFELPKGTNLAGFDDAAVVDVDGSEYLRLVSPDGIWVYWAGETAYLLVGDLPPDHLEQVLAELPRPKGQGNFISRLWQGLFG